MNGRGNIVFDDAPYCVIRKFDYEDRTQWMAFFHVDYLENFEELTDYVPEDAEMFEEGPARPSWGEEGEKYVMKCYRLPKSD